MKDFLSRFKIPTILGLGIILVGIITGVFLTLQEQIFTSKASVTLSPQNITLANVSDTEVSISWQTSSPVTSFTTYGKDNPGEQTVLDDRDTNPPAGGPTSYSVHYVTIKNLLPKTTYQYKIVSGKISSEVDKFTTAAPLTSQTGFRPIIGSILDGDKPLNEGIAYLSIAGATIQSSIVKSSGNFLIPISQIRKIDLSDVYSLTEDTTAKLTIVSPKGQSIALFKLKDAEKELPPIKIGENLDLTDIETLDKYDLNSDGKINATDNALILQNFGNPSTSSGLKNKKADLNGDGVVDQKDLDLMSKKINQP